MSRAYAATLREATLAAPEAPVALLAGSSDMRLRSALIRRGDRGARLGKWAFFRNPAHPHHLPCSLVAPTGQVIVVYDAGKAWSLDMQPAFWDRFLAAHVQACRRAGALVMQAGELGQGTRGLLGLARACGVERAIVALRAGEAEEPARAALREAGFADTGPALRPEPARAGRCRCGDPGCETCGPWLSLGTWLMEHAAARAEQPRPACMAASGAAVYGLRAGRYILHGAGPPGIEAGAPLQVFLREGRTVAAQVEAVTREGVVFTGPPGLPLAAVVGCAAPGAARLVRQAEVRPTAAGAPAGGLLFTLGCAWGPSVVATVGARWTVSCPRGFLAAPGELLVLARPTADGSGMTASFAEVAD